MAFKDLAKKASSWFLSPISMGHLLVLLVVGTAVLYILPRFLAKPVVVDTKSLEIEELITKVRCELAMAEKKMRDRGDLQLFELEDFKLELNFVVRSSGKLEAQVVGVGSALEAGNERVQKLTLNWKAKPESRESILPAIDAAAGEISIDGMAPKALEHGPCEKS